MNDNSFDSENSNDSTTAVHSNVSSEKERVEKDNGKCSEKKY